MGDTKLQYMATRQGELHEESEERERPCQAATRDRERAADAGHQVPDAFLFIIEYLSQITTSSEDEGQQ